MIKTKPKPCKTCLKNQAVNWRTECLPCIRKKEQAKILERRKLEAEKKKKAILKEKERKQKKLAQKRFSRQSMTRELDRLFSLYIRLRDRWNPCITCWRPYSETFQCWHFLSRRFLATRWDEKNAHGQCPWCNMLSGWEQYKHSIFVDQKYGPWTAEELLKKAQAVTRLPDEFFLEYIWHYHNRLKPFWIQTKKYYLEENQEK